MTDLNIRLSASLGSGYTLERELGGGGMSRVFVATDRELGRQVVVKVLPPEAAYGVSVDRFRREIALAARLQHPHIVPLLSAGESDGLPYFTMPLVEGESLRARLARSGKLPIPEAVRLLREIASALAYAHRKGVVHRDIKPENVLLADAHAMVTDFGVAKALRVATQDGDRLTSVGVALGTPAYMSPEQAAGDPETDQRSDIYAFGLIAYEMISGRPPFERPTAQALIAAHITETPASVSSHRPECPRELETLVMRCLEKDPADRPQSAEVILQTLDTIPAHVATRTVAERPRSVAVLPMVNVSGDPDNEHFSDGLTDELIGALSQVRELSVCGRTSAFALKGQGLSVQEIAKRLAVRNVVEGSVRRAGERLKVRVQLVDSEGNVVWSEAYDRKLIDVFAVQEDIAQAVVRALQIHLTGPLVRPATKDLVAYDAFLKGRAIRRRWTPNDLDLSIVYFEQAIARDPEYAAAYAWLSDAHVLQLVLGSKVSQEGIERGRRFAKHAVELDPKLADAHWALGQVLMCYDRDFRGADREYVNALALDPGHVDARHLHGISLLVQCRYEESLGELTQAIAVDPLLAEAHFTTGRTYLSMRQPERAMDCFRNAVDLAPDFAFARMYLGLALLQLGRPSEALLELERAVSTGGPRAAAHLANGYAVTGRGDQAREILRGLMEPDGAGLAAPFHIAMAHVGLGNIDLAFEWLDRASRGLDPWITAINAETAFDTIRGDARYAALVRRLGLRDHTD